jgi:hypothetical protein
MVHVKASSTKGRNLIRAQPDSRLARGPPQAVSAPSAQAQLGQTLSCSDLDRITLPTDRVACTFNAGIA